MNDGPKTVLAVHDLSGVGRCSLSVILPALSAMQVQVCPLPTAVLSTHTGGFGEVAFADLTDFLSQAFTHYDTLGMKFDCIYSGFFGSEEQMQLCLSYIREHPDTLAFVDPVMGDHGKRYRTYTPGMVARMQELVGAAHLITPNTTEAALLLGRDFQASYNRTEVKSILARLAEKGPQQVVITGVPLTSGEIANFGYDRNGDSFWQVTCDYVPVSYPGTGDLFAAILTGGLMTGDSLPIAIERATRFLELAINITYSYGTDTRHGVMFESALPWLSKREILKGYVSF